MATYEWLYVGIALAFLTAWINGANNAGNVVGVAIGARALNMKKAMLVAAVFELLGGVLFGERVSTTLMAHVVDLRRVPAQMLVAGVLVVLLVTFAWTLVSTVIKIPVSVSQSVVGGLVGFGIAVAGFSVVAWSKVVEIVASWFYLPFLSMAISYLVYKAYTRLASSTSWLKLVVSSCLLVFSATLVMLTLLLAKYAESVGFLSVLSWSLQASLLVSLLYYALVLRKLSKSRDSSSIRTEVSRHLLLGSCIAMSLAHGAHDVANTAGPLSIIAYASEHREPLDSAMRIPLEALLVSALGISIGMLTWGYRIIGTIGEKISPLTPEAGFVAQLSSAIAVVVVVRLGLVSSTTLAIVGSVLGVGLARGTSYVNFKTVLKIIATWIIGFPIVALLSLLALRTYTVLAT